MVDKGHTHLIKETIVGGRVQAESPAVSWPTQRDDRPRRSESGRPLANLFRRYGSTVTCRIWTWPSTESRTKNSPGLTRWPESS